MTDFSLKGSLRKSFLYKVRKTVVWSLSVLPPNVVHSTGLPRTDGKKGLQKPTAGCREGLAAVYLAGHSFMRFPRHLSDSRRRIANSKQYQLGMRTKTLKSMTLRMESEEIGKIRDDGVNDWNIVNTLMTQQHDEHITNVHDVANSMLE